MTAAYLNTSVRHTAFQGNTGQIALSIAQCGY